MRNPTVRERGMRALRHVLLAGKSLVSDECKLSAWAYNGTPERPPWLLSGGDCATNRGGDPAVDIGVDRNVIESRYQDYEAKDWRVYFSNKLVGKGLEIGALHRPLPVHDGMQVDYVDRLSLEDLRAHYPELCDLPLVRPSFVSNADTLAGVPDDTYDFLVSAHLIEHMRNPIGAVSAWTRVLKSGGLLYLIVPDKRLSFDRYRSRTLLPHFIEDFRDPSIERDYLHYLDYSVLVHSRCGDDALTDAQRLFSEDYSIHFHVFMPSDILDMIKWMSENVLSLSVVEGPCATPGSDEFHLLVQKGQA